MKSIRSSLIVCAIVLTAVLTFGGSALAGPKVAALKTVTFLPSDSPDVDGFHMWEREVNNAKGPITIRYLGGPEVIPMFEQHEAVRSGAVDAAWVPCAYYRNVLPNAFTMMLSHLTPWEERTSGLLDYMETLHNKKMNAHLLGRQLTYLPFLFAGKEPSYKPADLKGRKLRAGALYDNIYARMGIIGVTMTHGDTYSGLEKGVLDGVGCSTGDMTKFRLFEVIKYIYTPSFWSTNNIVLLINLDTWKSLSQEQKDLLEQTQIRLEKPVWEYYKKRDKELMEGLIKSGMKPTMWSEADQKWFLEMADEAQWTSVGKIIGKDEAIKIQKMMGY